MRLLKVPLVLGRAALTQRLLGPTQRSGPSLNAQAPPPSPPGRLPSQDRQASVGSLSVPSRSFPFQAPHSSYLPPAPRPIPIQGKNPALQKLRPAGQGCCLQHGSSRGWAYRARESLYL